MQRMNKLNCILASVFCTTFSLFLILYSLFGTSWISGCVPLSSIVIEESFSAPIASFPELQRSAELSSLDKRPLFMDQQIADEKTWLDQKLKRKKVCLNQGFFAYCLNGDGFFDLGDYQLCIKTIGTKRMWTRTEALTVCSIVATVILICIILLMFLVSFVFHKRGRTRSCELMLTATAFMSFVAGSIVLLGLLPIAMQAVAYSFNTTNFYNDIIKGMGTAYFVAMKVDWSIKDGDLTSSQAWARNIVNSMMDLGIDRDFFIALSAGVFLYFTCAVILVRSRSEVHEKYVSVFSSNQKLS